MSRGLRRRRTEDGAPIPADTRPCSGRSTPRGTAHILGRQPCRNRATVERDGVWWCGAHDPERAKARREERAAKERFSDSIRDEGERLLRRLGVQGGHVDFNFRGFTYTRAVVIPFEEAGKLVRQPAAKRRRRRAVRPR